MADFSEVVTKALENVLEDVVESKVQERCQDLEYKIKNLKELNHRLNETAAEDMELRARAAKTENDALKAENDALKAENEKLIEELKLMKNLEIAVSEKTSKEHKELTESKLAAKTENRALRETLYSVRDLMRVLDDEFGELERNVRDIKSSIRELQRELEEDD